ncbi:unknown protein [Paenibacillus amylolyticus]|uniref:Uncharacterized protein n=1 Tax=Paenibacillus amylolyticus TaxID=1451 RepID=A0A100VMY4_PAEAM|nr:unknown protein [Paenibacillus amylolyticus]
MLERLEAREILEKREEKYIEGTIKTKKALAHIRMVNPQRTRTYFGKKPYHQKQSKNI